MKYLILVIFALLFLGCDKKETWGLYKYPDERLVHFEHFIDNRGKCWEYAKFLNDKYTSGNTVIRCYEE